MSSSASSGSDETELLCGSRTRFSSLALMLEVVVVVVVVVADEAERVEAVLGRVRENGDAEREYWKVVRVGVEADAELLSITRPELGSESPDGDLLEANERASE